VVSSGCHMHHSHIKAVLKCRDKISSIYQRIGGDGFIASIALDLECDEPFGVSHLTDLSFLIGDPIRVTCMNYVSMTQLSQHGCTRVLDYCKC